MPRTSMQITHDSAKTIVCLEGNWDFQTESKHLEALKNVLKNRPLSLVIDCACIQRIDFIFIVFLLDLLKSFDLNPEFIHTPNKMTRLLQTIPKDNPSASTQKELIVSRRSWNIFEKMGRYIEDFIQESLDFLNFCGMTLYAFTQALAHPLRIRIASLCYHINESGFKALPVSVLTALIVGAAVTLQGAMQLQGMGVPLMSVETTAKLSLREMGPFILALVIAGRSASSFTAQIGVMGLTEELDAMKTMNFSPFEFLVLPRVLALVIAMPLLVFLADAFALLGGMLAIKYQLGISFGAYIERFYDTVSWNHFWVGLIKAPFFGWAIAMVGCFRGFEVKGDTESVGRLTTISVVNALFWIIFINALFSVIFTKLNV
ncbi:ABC transporter [Helicobacter sp. 12S02634-8]|uniref:MlaE family lipid ABC transporter permease subunit n=1 Tax=Helicobacter sp. 12S02634-8 TaxID=1476199 RepID=UPI000BA7D8FF|nr:MlaE family lipid ABC transporter permease subunit [Helicobacter sp. 12S02634-8]PAF47817.1 ABC transporter [Helicobacter sp. 12S02634-8]